MGLRHQFSSTDGPQSVNRRKRPTTKPIDGLIVEFKKSQRQQSFENVSTKRKAGGPPTARPPVSLNGADWGSSDAKHLIVQDTMDGLAPCGEKIKDVGKLFEEMCAHQPEFKDFPCDRERHKSRIERIQKALARLKWSANCDKKCLIDARKVHPKRTHGPTGTVLQEGSEAARCLAIAMENGEHLVPNFKPGTLWASKACHRQFSKRRFSKRIDQLREAAKPHGENPQQTASEREKKQIKKIKNRPKFSRIGTISAHDQA